MISPIDTLARKNLGAQPEEENTWEKLHTLSYGCTACDTLKQQTSAKIQHVHICRGTQAPRSLSGEKWQLTPAFDVPPQLLFRSSESALTAHSAAPARGDGRERSFTGALPSRPGRRPGRHRVRVRVRDRVPGRGHGHGHGHGHGRRPGRHGRGV